MKKNANRKKTIVATIILFFMLSVNLSTFASSTFIYDTNDGVWYDDFEDYSTLGEAQALGRIEKYEDCILSNGSVILGYGSNVRQYDYSTEENEHEAFEYTDFLTPEGEEDLLRPKNILLETPIGNKVDDIARNDNEVLETKGRVFDYDVIGVYYKFSPVHHFRFKIDQNRDYVKSFKIAWFSGDYRSDAYISSVKFYIWDTSFPLIDRWKFLYEVPYNSAIGTNANGDIVVNSSKTAFIDPDGYMDILVVGIPDDTEEESATLETDYIELEVTSTAGYLDSGYVVSTLISKQSSGRWESIVWGGSRASDTASINMQVLDQDDKLIISGKSSPLDLSTISTAINSIKINASFSSKDIAITPRLFSWGVTWQTSANQFYDSFTTNLRIEESAGINIEGGKINMSAFYSDWPIFGKTPSNTRLFEGDGPGTGYLYWKTKRETVGGGYRSPIISDGRVYVASPIEGDKTIYAYNATEASTRKNYVDSSEELGYVDSAVAITDDLVIVATGLIDSPNEIFALNKYDLKDLKWNYSFSENICFSSAPTVSNEKIFFTSWNGMKWDTPYLSFLYQFNRLRGNNKIIVLNMDGSLLWSQDLSAGSLSTPAVADGMVFVGCDNMFGNNLFAFNDETGKKIWNASVGLAGRSSPVVHDGKVFVVAKEQSILSFRGNIKLFALNEYTGEILWNYTLAENVFAFEGFPKAFRYPNMMAASITPSVYMDTLVVVSTDGTVYALSTEDGKELWVQDELTANIRGILPTYTSTSPVIAYDKVYVALANGMIYSLKLSNGAVVWDYDCNIEDEEIGTSSYILASPIIADGVLYVSLTQELKAFSGSIFAIGNYTVNQRARVVSNPIHVPPGYWWDKFYAVNNTEGSFKFSILDENYNVLIDNIKDKQMISNYSSLNCNVIRLRAEFSRINDTFNPILDSWSVTWKSETNIPVLVDSSFVPDPSGWINTNTPTCSIKVYDLNPGLDVDSAKYNIIYLSNNGKLVTRWLDANCTGEKGTRNNETITAKISDANSESIYDLRQIVISIKDLAGNNASIGKTFKKDTIKPNSSIKNVTEFSLTYNEPVSIVATASDYGDPDVNKSGVKNVALYYRLKGGENWLKYGESTIYNWTFKNDTSGEYEFYTVASDYAGNVEDKDEAELSFVFDMNEPSEPDHEDEYRFYSLPDFSIVFEDDYELESVYYRMNFHGTNQWTKIEDDIYSKSYTGEWTLSEDDWDYIEDTDTTEEEYYLYFRLLDSAGNQYITPDDEGIQIIKTTAEFTYYLDLSDFFEWHLLDNSFKITIPEESQEDIDNAELYYRYSEDNEEWSEWKKCGGNISTPPFEWLFNAEEGSGYYEFKTKAWNAAGVSDESPVDSIRVVLFPTIPIIVIVVLAFLLIISTVFLRGRMKKKKD